MSTVSANAQPNTFQPNGIDCRRSCLVDLTDAELLVEMRRTGLDDNQIVELVATRGTGCGPEAVRQFIAELDGAL